MINFKGNSMMPRLSLQSLRQNPKLISKHQKYEIGSDEEIHHSSQEDNTVAYECIDHVNVEKFVQNLNSNEVQTIKKSFTEIPKTLESEDSTVERHCKAKDRYLNVYSNEISRVKLIEIEGEESSDYINASYIAGWYSGRDYIATQAPKSNTTWDFWRMIFEQKSPTIVMLASFCDDPNQEVIKYWPNLNECMYFKNDLSVRNEEEFEFQYYTTSSIVLMKTVGNKYVEHSVKVFHHLDWSSRISYETITSICQFRKAVNLHHHGVAKNMGPMVVHCKSGIGRTGSFLFIDYNLTRLEHKTKSFRIHSYIFEMRVSRPGMLNRSSLFGISLFALLIELKSKTRYETFKKNISSAMKNLIQVMT